MDEKQLLEKCKTLQTQLKVALHYANCKKRKATENHIDKAEMIYSEIKTLIYAHLLNTKS